MSISGITTWVACGLLALGTACTYTPPPRDRVAQADATVISAKTRQAAIDAPAPMQTAEEKLERAKSAMAGGHNLEAKEMAQQSTVDADLAVAQADRAVAQKKLVELDTTIRKLRVEVR